MFNLQKEFQGVHKEFQPLQRGLAGRLVLQLRGGFLQRRRGRPLTRVLSPLKGLGFVGAKTRGRMKRGIHEIEVQTVAHYW